MVILFFAQRKIMFLAERADLEPANFHAERMTKHRLTAHDGTDITAWFSAANVGKPTILYFHGNASHIGAEYRVIRYNRMIDEGYGVLAVSYRGYGDSDGSPTEQGLYQDARAGMHFLHEQHHLRNQDIFLMGESMGSGVVSQLATEYDVAAVVLDSPYLSVIEAAKVNYWWLPVDYLLRDRFDSWKKVGRITSPITIIHGDADMVIPIAQGKRLFSLANEPKKLDILEGVGHVDAHPDIIIEELTRLTVEYF